MSNIKLVLVSLVVSALVLLGAMMSGVFTPPLGSGTGQDVDSHQFFGGGITVGGRVSTTSTAATYTMNAKDLASLPTYIDWLPNDDITVSLSATSTFGYVPNIGDSAVIYVRNASTTAAATITLEAVDAGVDLQDNEDGSSLTIDGLDWGRLTLIRESLHLTTVIFDKYIEAD